MKLREKFLKLYPHQTENYLDIDEAILFEKIADDFAIGFTEWICDNYDNESIFLGIVYIKSLLIDYKKEKGL